MGRLQSERALRAEVKVSSAYRCCVCGRQGEHIHHIDGDRENNTLSNLALLCIGCHDQAHTRGGIRLRLVPEDIQLSRDRWLKEVKERGLEWVAKTSDSGDRVDNHEVLLRAALDAIAIDAIRRFDQWAASFQWDELSHQVSDLFRYTDFRYSACVKHELLSAVGASLWAVRLGMPHATIHAAKRVASAALPIRTLVGKQPRLSGADHELLGKGCEIGFTIAHGCLKYRSDLVGANIGLDLLWDILRFAEVNDCEDMRRAALEEFDRLEKVSIRHLENRQEDVLRWLGFKRADALAVRSSDQAVVPQDLLQRYEGLHI